MRIGRQGLAIISLLASGAAFAGTPGWSVSESSGQVTIASTGLVKAALRGGGVAVGDIVSTGRNGRAVLVRGEEYLVVAPNSRIRVADPVKSGGMTQIIEQFGNVIFKIKKMTMPHFAVETPFLAAVVKGTTFSVTVTDKGASVQVIEGRVEVATRDGGASYMVLPGDIGSVSATAPGRLDVQGHEAKSITSPTPAAAEAAVTASVAESANPAGDVQLSGAIDAAVGEGAVNLEAMSDGMVKGDSSMLAMVASTTQGAKQAEAPTTAPATLAASTQMAPLTAEAETVETVEVPLPPVEDTAQAGGKPAPAGPKPVILVSGPPVQAVIKPAPAAVPPAGVIEIPAEEVVVALPPTPAPVAAPVVVAANAPGNGNSGSGNNGNGNRFAFGGNGNNGNAFGNNGNGNGNGNNNNNNGNGRHN
jgi:hypothetical protein